MPRRFRVMLFVTLVLALGAALPSYASLWRSADSSLISSSSPSGEPTSVTLAGSVQSELGCAGDWDPSCADTYLNDEGNGVWRAAFDVPMGSWEYKMALNGTWDVAYPADNVPLEVTDNPTATVRFYYDHKTNAVLDSVNNEIAVAAGSFQSELDCPGDWQPSCVISLLTDVDGDGVYTFVSGDIPVGDYEFKVALNEAWDISYPADNMLFSVTDDAEEVTISWDTSDNSVTVDVAIPLEGPASAALGGDFQSELGCDADWDSACPNTELTLMGNHVWRAEYDILMGDWEYKVALNDAWLEAYPVDNKALSVTDNPTATLRFYYDHKTNAVLDSINDEIAVAAGSFQSELGCMGDNNGDWLPSCVRSLLTDVDGDGIYTFVSADLPAGDYQFKVALNEAWDVSYPADNVLFTVSQDNELIIITWDTATNEVDVTTPSEIDGELVAEPVEHPFEDEILYFLIPDRFNDGNTDNNCGDFDGTCVISDTEENVLTHGYLPRDRGYYHGGDIPGLIDKLDYLEEMGVTAIWVGPIFKNKPVQPDSSNLYGHSSGYHGYWITDFMNVDPHLGTNADFETLVDEAHSRGIKVLMDIITNHTADVILFEEELYDYRNKTDYPFLDINGEPFDDLDFAYYGQDNYSFPTMTLESFPYTPYVPEGELVKNPAWLNDLTLYHNRGNTSFTGENSVYGDFFGLDDLFTARKEVVDGMIDIYSHWIETYQVDGFRIDTTKHVNIEFWQLFGPEIQAAAEAEGIDHFFAFGEVYRPAPSFLSYFSKYGQLQSTIDFAFQEASRGFVSEGGASQELNAFFEQDDYYTDQDSNAYAMPIFLGNHDMGRIGYFLKQDNPDADDDELLARSKLAHALMFFVRGQPVIYYGDEQGFVGDGGDKLARQDMFPSLVPEYNDDDLIGTDATTADDNFDTTHPIYQALVAYSEVYLDNIALRRGAHVSRYGSDSAGIYAFSRIDRDEQVEYIVAFNNADSEQTATFSTYLIDTDYVAVYPAANPDVTTDASGNITLTVPALDFVIYKASSALPASDEAPNIAIGNLENLQEVTLVIESTDGHDVIQPIHISADLDSNSYAEVTFVVKASGTPTYTLIGVDNAPPYSIYLDVTPWLDDAGRIPEGFSLDIRAIVSDLNGHVSSDQITGVVPVVEEATPAGPAYAIIHYYRPDGDYGDHTTGNSEDFWGLHLWGEAIDPDEGTEWTTPKPFLGEDEYGRFAWIKLADASKDVNFIIHRGNVKDGTDEDRAFNPTTEGPEIWTMQDDGAHYLNQADGQGYVTIHYQRADGDYGDYTSDDYNDFWGLHLWTSEGGLTDWTTPKKADGQDEYGVYFTIPLTDVLSDFDIPLNFIVHKGDVKDPADSPDRSFEPASDASIWLMQDDLAVYGERGAAEGYATIHYHRPDGDYGDPTSSDFNDFWGMHVWTGAAEPNPGWTTPVTPTGQDMFGIYFEVPLVEDADQLAYILHRGDEKDPGPDQFLVFADDAYEVWQPQGADPENPYILPVGEGGVAACTGANLSNAKAHWVAADTIAWEACADSYSYELASAPNGFAAIGGMITINLTLTGDLSDEIVAKFPHLQGLPALKIDAANLNDVPAMLKGQVAVYSYKADASIADGTSVQIPGVLDELYAEAAYDEPLGVNYNGDVPTLSVWAPTANSVTLHLFDDSTTTMSSTVPMNWDAETGIWSVTGNASWTDKFYLYNVEVYAPAAGEVVNNLVTDPYAISLSMNSKRSQMIDLSDASLMPEGWDEMQKPALDAPEDSVLYELHIRDFSVNDESVPEADKGKYTAFTHAQSNGMQHLQALADAGLTHLHLLPSFDIATINEDPTERTEPEVPDAAPDSEEQQAAVSAVRDEDAFNWGYDPFHYTTPEGSYSTDADGSIRILEYRQMVQALNEAGLRVVMDVVYNHTNSSGQDEKSVLDKVVPGYYHRLDDNGGVTSSTCCQNTATEHAMMEKLMIDSLVTWATAYKVDGFRFDLMGHHMVSNMIAVSDTLHALTEASDGVDGSKLYLYGEGWNFGEVADGARGENATQLNVGGLGIGTFNDRLRDAVRGGGPFDTGLSMRTLQGFISGLYYDSNDVNPDSVEAQKDKLLLYGDQIRVGLAGNLADYSFTDRNGNMVTGAEVDYNGAPAGYTQDPQEHIIYVEAHDNQTLFDLIQYKAPVTSTLDARTRMQNVGLSFACLAQGVPFFHAGSDMLRSKSLDRNSYNSGDWFNKLDFTYQDNNWGVGLPAAQDNGGDWEVMQPLLANTALDPQQEQIMQSVNFLRECLEMRKSTPLFRLQTAEQVQNQLTFHNTGPDQIPGLIVMSIADTMGLTRAGEADQVVVYFNATDEAQSFTVDALAGVELELHPIQAVGSDAIVATSAYDSESGTFNVPARTTAVFVTPGSFTAVSVSELDTAQHRGLAIPLTILGATLLLGIGITVWRRRTE